MKTRILPLLLSTALLARADLLPPAQDTSSARGKLTVANGKAATLAVDATRKAFVLFNLNNLPPDAQPADIANARLRVYFPSVTKPGDIAIHTVTENWTEAAASSEPAVSMLPIATFPAAKVIGKKFVEVDVTLTVQMWRAAPATNMGFAFVAGGITKVLVGAKEGSGSGYPAELEVEIDREIGVASVGDTELASNLTLGGTTMGTFSGNLLGNATSATTAATAGSFTGTLAGDVTGTQAATAVSLVGGSTAANVHAAELLANAATSANTANAIVIRDANGSFSTGNILLDGGLRLPVTTSTTVGVIAQNGVPLIHAFGAGNFFAGAGAGNFSMTGGFNTASGVNALSSNTTGSNNIATGVNALSSNTTGIDNTAGGVSALSANKTGGQNVAIGNSALSTQSFTNGGTAWNSNNVALGSIALERTISLSAPGLVTSA